jgi:hypothetical protein
MVFFFSSTPTNVPSLGFRFPAPLPRADLFPEQRLLPTQSSGQAIENKGQCKIDLQSLSLNIQLSVDSARAALYIGC